MKIALRRDAAKDATAIQRLFCTLIKVRLVSQFCHGGIVIDGALYHITGSHGAQVLQPGNWTPESWLLFEVGGDDGKAIELFNDLREAPLGLFQRAIYKLTKGYDWFSLLAFVGPMVRVSWLQYCFELCWLMSRGSSPTFRVTPEMLIMEAHDG